MGAKFWLGFIGVTIGLGVAGLVLWLLIDAAWYRWGFLGMFLFFSAVVLFIGWLIDRRNARDYEDYEVTPGGV
jgi:hypothetical protein